MLHFLHYELSLVVHLFAKNKRAIGCLLIKTTPNFISGLL